VAYALSRFQNGGSSKHDLGLIAALFDGLRQKGAPVEGSIPKSEFDRALSAAREIAADDSKVEEKRLSAVHLLTFESYARTSGLLSSLLRPDQPQAIQLAAAAALDGYRDASVGRDLVNAWPRLAGRVREEFVGILLKRKERVAVLLDAIEAGAVRREALSLAQQAQLRSHRDSAIREQAVKVLGRAATPERQAVVEAFESALSLKGDSANGRRTFQARCATCHKLGSEGHALGPDLATVKSGGKEKLIVAILDPNREVAPNFLSYAIETKDGESLSGVLASESANSVTLRMAGGAESVIARANIASLQSQGRSLMPEGLEEGLKPQDMADLLEFIVTGP
jgi:putative heme-binding domain-containing protein